MEEQKYLKKNDFDSLFEISIEEKVRVKGEKTNTISRHYFIECNNNFIV